MRVLLVEDHRQYAELIRDKLNDVFDFDVLVSTDPEEANRQVRGNSYDVVVVDVLYRALSEKYNLKRSAARSSLQELAPYNLSGLTVLHELTRLER